MSITNPKTGVSHPTPQEAVSLLRAHARKRELPPNDNNFDDAANVIERFIGYASAISAARQAIDNLADLADGEDDADLPADTGVVVKIGERITDFTLTLKDLRDIAALRRELP